MKLQLKIGVALALGIALGCKPSEPQGVEALKAVDFIVADDVRVTAADAWSAAMILSRINALAGRPVKEKAITNWVNSTALKVTPSLVSSRLLEVEMDRRGVRATEESTAKVLDRFRRQTRQKTDSLDELAAKFGPLEEAFRRQFGFECRLEAFLSAQEECQVTEEDIDIEDTLSRRADEKAREENARAKRRGEEAWAKLNAGESWDSVAQAYSEDKLLYGKDCSYEKEWETFPLENFYLKELADALRGKTAGEYTKPIDTDEGLIIAKVLSVKGGCYECVRILIRLRVNTEILGKEELRRKLTAEKRKDFQIDLLRDLKAARTFSYPLGTNFSYKVWQ